MSQVRHTDADARQALSRLFAPIAYESCRAVLLERPPTTGEALAEIGGQGAAGFRGAGRYNLVSSGRHRPLLANDGQSAPEHLATARMTTLNWLFTCSPTPGFRQRRPAAVLWRYWQKRELQCSVGFDFPYGG